LFCRSVKTTAHEVYHILFSMVDRTGAGVAKHDEEDH
jgi:hypothetical protein